MGVLANEIIHFFHHQNFSIVTTFNKNGFPHNSCKGIVDIDRKKAQVYLLDLYKAKTFKNLKQNPHISVTGVDEHKFAGYCLKGKAEIIGRDKLSPHLLKAWEKKINGRITQRLLKEIRGEKGHRHQPEALLPRPAYLIVMKVKEVVDLAPPHLKVKEK